MSTVNQIQMRYNVVQAALTAFLTALGTTSCLGYGPISF